MLVGHRHTIRRDRVRAISCALILSFICACAAAIADNYLSPSPAQNEQYGINYKESIQQADSFDAAHARGPRFGNDGGIGSSSMQTQSATASDSAKEARSTRTSPAIVSEPNFSSPAFSQTAGSSFSERISSPAFSSPEVKLSDFGLNAPNSASVGLSNFGFNNATDSYGRSLHGGGFLKLNLDDGLKYTP